MSGRVSDSRSSLRERYGHVWANNVNCPTDCTVLSVSILHSLWKFLHKLRSSCQFSGVLVADRLPPAPISSCHQTGELLHNRVHRLFLVIRISHLYTFGFYARSSSKLTPPTHTYIYTVYVASIVYTLGLLLLRWRRFLRWASAPYRGR